MRKHSLFNAFYCFLLLLSSTPAFAQITLAPLFSDHMVLQRNTAIKVTGQATKNSAITVKINNQLFNSTVNEQGDWQVVLAPTEAGGPFQLDVSTATEQKIINDVYFGDVWLASGQSNMEWKLKWQVNNHIAEINDSHYPLIRYFDVENRYRAQETSTLDNGEWVLASDKVSGEFSAVAWLFAKRLHLEKNIPIAIIDATWGGTPAEAWTPLTSLTKLKGYTTSAQELIAHPEQWDAKFEQTRADEITKWSIINSTKGHDELKLASFNYNDKDWLNTDLPLNENLTDIVWARTTFQLTKADIADIADITATTNTTEQGITIELGSYPQFAQVYVNEQLVINKLGEQKDSPYFIAAKYLKAGNNLLVIRALNSWSNQINIGRKEQMFVKLPSRQFNINKNWRINNTLENKLPAPAKYWQKTGVLYNAMIHPIIHYPLKGVIWYQGESNIGRSSEYHELFTTLINSWRNLWQQHELPFIFAQLASLHEIYDYPVESSWALLREAQTQSLSLPHTAMTVLIDAGEKWDIHPRNKQIVADRMWHAANAIAYDKNIVYSGPMATSFKIDHNNIVISYQDLGSGFAKQDNIIGFEIAGSNGKYYTAQAKITDKNIVIWSDQVTTPQSVRYGWADNSPANLYNLEGFPAVPFRMGE